MRLLPGSTSSTIIFIADLALGVWAGPGAELFVQGLDAAHFSPPVSLHTGRSPSDALMGLDVQTWPLSAPNSSIADALYPSMQQPLRAWTGTQQHSWESILPLQTSFPLLLPHTDILLPPSLANVHEVELGTQQPVHDFAPHFSTTTANADSTSTSTSTSTPDQDASPASATIALATAVPVPASACDTAPVSTSAVPAIAPAPPRSGLNSNLAFVGGAVVAMMLFC